jgi:hypothetical protein
MTLLKTSLLSAFAAALLTACALFLFSRHERQEIQLLNTANEKLRIDLLAQSRSEAPLAPGRLEPAAAANSGEPTQPDPKPVVTVYRNEGNATAVAALQTIAWACDRGDTKTIAQMLAFEGDGRGKIAAILPQLPASLRTEASTPEELAAMVIVSGFVRRPFPAADILARATTTPLENDAVKLRLPGTTVDGGVYRKTDAGWKFTINEASVDAQIAKLRPVK